MRHGKKFNHLGRKKGHRRALLKNMACSLIEHKRINTTVAKAKALRLYVEPLITKSKNNTTHSRRVVFSYLQNKEAIKELFGPIAGKVASRPGGYVRVIKTGFRKGDGAEMAMIEFVDYNEVYTVDSGSGEGKSKKRKRRRGGKKTATTAAAVVAGTAAAAAAAAATVEETVEEVVEDQVVETAAVVEETVEAAPVVVEEVTETVVENVGDEDPEMAQLEGQDSEDATTTSNDEEE